MAQWGPAGPPGARGLRQLPCLPLGGSAPGGELGVGGWGGINMRVMSRRAFVCFCEESLKDLRVFNCNQNI